MAIGKVLIIGKTHYDSILNQETQRFVRSPGASGYFAAVSASFFARPTLVSKIGCDFSQEHLDRINSMGVDTSRLQHSETPSLVWKARYVSPTIYETLGWENRDAANDEITDLPDEVSENHRFAYMGEMHPSSQLNLLNRLSGIITMTDTKRPWVRDYPQLFKETLRASAMSVMNEEEAGMLFQKNDPVELALSIQALGPRIAIVNLGEKGSVMAHMGRVFRIKEAICKSPVDTTGAGDASSGAFVASLAAGKSPEDAFIAASVMASFVVQDYSINRMMGLTRAEIEETIETAKTSGLLVRIK